MESKDSERHSGTITIPPRMLPHAVTIAYHTSAIEALRFNKYNSEPARQAIKTACTLLETGWQISTVWTPSPLRYLRKRVSR
jgi:hypothetical protein